MKKFIVSLLLITACSGVAALSFVEGHTNYAKAKWSKNHCVDFVGKYEAAYVTSDAISSEVRLSDNKALAKEQDIIEINLLQAYVRSFPEALNLTFWRAKQGEIAVLASVNEMEQKASNSQSSNNDAIFDFSSSGIRKAIVIHFTEDARENRFLNFSQLPVYGPISYKGRPLLLAFHMVELDGIGQDRRVANMLRALANVGRSALVSSNPAFAYLGDIGEALIASNDDDVMFRYHLTFRAPEKTLGGNVHAAVLEYGNYIIAKRESRGLPGNSGIEEREINWSDYTFNQRNGRIYRKKNPKDYDCDVLARDFTYLTFQIRKAPHEADLRHIEFSKLKTSLLEQSENDILSTDFANIPIRLNWSKDASDLIRHVRDQQPGGDGCRQLSQETKQALSNLIAQLIDAKVTVKGSKNNQSIDLRSTEIEYIYKRLLSILPSGMPPLLLLNDPKATLLKKLCL